MYLPNHLNTTHNQTFDTVHYLTSKPILIVKHPLQPSRPLLPKSLESPSTYSDPSQKH